MLTSLPADIIVPSTQRQFADAYVASRKGEFQPAEGRPICIHGLGIPGVGKTTCIKQFIRENDKFQHVPLVKIGNDDIMQVMPDYQAAIKKKWIDFFLKHLFFKRTKKAFENFEIPARAIGYELLTEAVQGGVHLLLDHSGTAEYRPALLGELKEKGYYIVMVYVHCKLQEALRRSKIRERETGRHVPDSYFTERQKMIEALMPVYREIVDEFHAIDNSVSK